MGNNQMTENFVGWRIIADLFIIAKESLDERILIKDSIAPAGDIFVARTNGTSVFTIQDGGIVTPAAAE